MIIIQVHMNVNSRYMIFYEFFLNLGQDEFFVERFILFSYKILTNHLFFNTIESINIL